MREPLGGALDGADLVKQVGQHGPLLLTLALALPAGLPDGLGCLFAPRGGLPHQPARTGDVVLDQRVERLIELQTAR